MLNITDTVTPKNSSEWRDWLEKHHAVATEIWVVMRRADGDHEQLSYLESVNEALCFGWIDGISKKMDAEHTAQRFTPRKPNSHWTELNKERARRLIAEGRMTEAGRRVIPDLSEDAFRIPPDILRALKADEETWENFQQFPARYQRIRIGYIEEMRKQPTVFATRLNNFLKKTKQNKMFGQME